MVMVKTTRLLPAADTDLDVKDGIWPQVQVRQQGAEIGFRVVINLNTDAILGTAYIEENIERILQKNETVTPTE